MLTSILDAMDKAGERLTDVRNDAIGDLQRVSFALSATKKNHDRLRVRLLSEPAISALFTFRDLEED
jgi:putative Mg2+ transporter-C (MgtC) family protein